MSDSGMSTERMSSASGSCLCGGVAYEVHGPMRPVTYCHCNQCRKTSGHIVAATACKPDDLSFTADDSLVWFQSPAAAQRGFCGTCGSSLFWRPAHAEYISIMAGTLEAPTGLQAVDHIFVADAADYYTINDGLPRHSGDWPPEAGW